MWRPWPVNQNAQARLDVTGQRVSKSFQEGGANDQGKPGASEWGTIAGERGGDNGQINRDYKKDHGGNPTKGNDK